MAEKTRLSPGFIAFIALMLLLVAIGVFLMVYGSAHNGIPVPSIHSDGLFAGVPHG